MTNFIPGKIVKTFQTKTGKEAIIRYPRWEDLDTLTEYINELSQEDVGIAYSGEKITIDDEREFLGEVLKAIENKEKIYLVCEVDDMIAGVTEIGKVTAHRKRGHRISSFGITVRRMFRGEGIGDLLLQTVLDEAKRQLDGIQIVRLDVYATNNIAQKLYSKNGFKEYGRLPKSILYRGEYVDLIEMYKVLD